jgi:hypothetical protein
MEGIKNRKFFKEIQDGAENYAEEAKDYFEKITGEKLSEKFNVYFCYLDEDTLGIQTGNLLLLSLKLTDKKLIKFTVSHELFHFGIRALGKAEYFDRTPDYSSLAFPFWETFVDKSKGEGNKNFIIEGAADLFAAKLISENENEIPKNIFLVHHFDDPSLRDVFLAVVATTFCQIDGTTDDTKRVEKIKEIFSDTEHLLEFIGDTVILFAYEVYKKERKNVDILLKDILSSPQKTVEEVIKKFRNNVTGELFKDTLSDLSNEFAAKRCFSPRK